jgi:tRNA(Ile)-lysidine synthase
MVLLDALGRVMHSASSLAPSQLGALHVNHGLSPKALQWERFCRLACAERGVQLRVRRVAVERGSADGLESAARRARYGAFSKTKADWLLLAHHRDDQAETLLFNLLRGTGVRGAAGIPKARDRVLRPLLEISRQSIEEYAQQLKLSWIEDESNFDSAYSRNFLRNEILPLLRERFPAASESLGAAAGRFSEALGLLDDLALLDLSDAMARFPVQVCRLAPLSEPRARNVLRYLLAIESVQIPSEDRLREALRQLLTAGLDRHPAIELGTRTLVRRKGWILLE